MVHNHSPDQGSKISLFTDENDKKNDKASPAAVVCRNPFYVPSQEEKNKYVWFIWWYDVNMFNTLYQINPGHKVWSIHKSSEILKKCAYQSAQHGDFKTEPGSSLGTSTQLCVIRLHWLQSFQTCVCLKDKQRLGEWLWGRERPVQLLSAWLCFTPRCLCVRSSFCFRRWGTRIKAFWGLLSSFLHAEEESTYTATKSSPGTGERSEGEAEQSDAALWFWWTETQKLIAVHIRFTWEPVTMIQWKKVLYTRPNYFKEAGGKL